MSLEEKHENQSDVKTNYHLIDHKKKFLVILKFFWTKKVNSAKKRPDRLKLLEPRNANDLISKNSEKKNSENFGEFYNK